MNGKKWLMEGFRHIILNEKPQTGT